MSKRKIIFITTPAVIVIGVGILIWGSYGFTPKSRFTHCMRDCYDLMILESSKQYCPGKCTEIHKFNPTAAELNKIIAEIENKNINTDTAKTNTNTAAKTNTAQASNTNSQTNSTQAANTNTDYQNRSYYCEWSWPQKIIDKDTQEVIYECEWQRPWCFFADYTYEKVGCCLQADHVNCTTLPDLLLNE
jgi:hypothetical protein